ncbi:MAG: PAS domain-containing protein [Janthinobacterium lividum]
MLINPILDFEDKSLKNFFTYSLQSMLITDIDFKTVLQINSTGLSFISYSKEEFSLQDVEKVIPQTSQQKLVQASDSLVEQQQFKKEISLISQAGKILYAEAVVSSILYDGKEARLLVLTDITEKKLYRALLEEAVEEELTLREKNKQLKKIAYFNFHLARKPLANILGLVNVLDQTAVADQTSVEAIEFLKECSNELNELIKGLDPQVY